MLTEAKPARPRLLIVVNHAGYFVSHRMALALAAREAGWEVHIATPASRHVPEIESAALPWHPIRLTRSGKNPLAEIRTFRDLLSLYRNLRPDLVHHVTSKPVLYGTIAARRARVPAVVNALAGLGHLFLADDLVHRLLRGAVGHAYSAVLAHPRMRLIFQNEDDRALFVEHGWLRRDQTVLIAGSGVDTDVFHPAGKRVAGPPVVVLPSRMLWTKGVGEFVAAAAILRAEGSDAKFLLAGEPDPDNPASIDVRQLRIWSEEGAVEYLGRRNDMPDLLRSADVVALPSYREGLPKSLVEAAASGLPAVTTDVPGCRDVVRNGENGLVVPIRNAEALADALRTLIDDPLLRRKMGDRGREIALADYSLRGVIDSTLRLYKELGH